MFPRCPRLLNGHIHLQLPHRSIRLCIPVDSLVHRRPLLSVDCHFQLRLKSNKTNRQLPNSSRQPSPTPRTVPPPQSAKPQPSNRTSEQPIPQPALNSRRDSTPSSTSDFIADIRDWRYSQYLFFTIVSATSFVVFCFWVREAHRAAEAKNAAEIDKQDDAGRGRFVTGSIEDTRYVTPGQEWLLDNFTVTPINMQEGRYWTLVTSIFSHQLPVHLALNIMAAQFLMTPLCRLFGTIPIATSFFIGGVGANYVVVSWMGKRAGDSFNKKYPGQFFGYLGMSGAVLSVVGFGAAALPGWKVRLWNVIPIKVPHLVIGVWLFSALQYWTQTGWDKIQSGVSLRDFELTDNRLMGI